MTKPKREDVFRLRPCPFCGHAPVLEEDGHGAYRVGCEDAGCRVNPHTVDYVEPLRAVVAWNQRMGDTK